jgi:hypothetical protein
MFVLAKIKNLAVSRTSRLKPDKNGEPTMSLPFYRKFCENGAFSGQHCSPRAILLYSDACFHVLRHCDLNSLHRDGTIVVAGWLS